MSMYKVPLYLSVVKPEEHAFILLIRTRMLSTPEKTKETMAMVMRRVQRLRAA